MTKILLIAIPASIIWIFGCFLMSCYGQNQKAIDSLISVLEDRTGKDRLTPLIDLTIELFNQDNEHALSIINEAREVAWLSGDSLMIVKTQRINLQILLSFERLGEAIAQGEAVLPMAMRLKFTRESVLIVNSLGIAYLYRGQYDKSFQAHFNTFDLGKQLNDSSLMAMGIYNIGIGYYKLKDYNKGLRYLKKSLSIKTALNITDHLLLMNISLCYSHLNDQANAQKYLEESLNACGKDCSGWSMMHLKYAAGCIALAAGLDDQSEKAFLDSYELAIKLKDHRIQFDNIYYLSEIFLRKKDIKTARKYLNEAEVIVNEGLPFNLELLKIYSRLSDLFSVLRDYKKIAAYQGKYIQLRDSIYNEALTTNLMKIESDFLEQENVQKLSEQQEILLLKEEVIGRQFILNVVVGLLAFVTTAFLVVVFRSLNQKKRLNYLLDKKIGQRTVELQISRNQLLAALKERDIMMERASEEINETVGTIKGLCFITGRDIDDPRLRPYMDKIDSTSSRLKAHLRSEVFPAYSVSNFTTS